MEVIVDRYEIVPGQSFDGVARQKALMYRCYVDKVDKKRLWMVAANVDNPAEHIYMGYQEYTGSRGFAGRTLVFNLVDQHMSISLQGPWHSNAEALYAATGIDVRNTCKTFVVIGLGRSFAAGTNGRDVITDIVYMDESPKLGSYTRDKEIAQAIMKDNPDIDKLYTYSDGCGGSSHGPYLRGRDYETH